MTTGIQEEIWENLLDSQEFKLSLLFTKTEDLDKDIEDMRKRFGKIEQDYQNLLLNDSVKESFVYDNARRKTSAKKSGSFESTDTTQESKNITERAIEFLTKWSEIQDISEQVQFAAVIAAKIDKLKKTSFIQSNEVKKKICILLRNVIRLNVTDDVFSREQLDLLKKGFLLLAADDTQKEDLLQLNRELRKEKLITMPAWE